MILGLVALSAGIVSGGHGDWDEFVDAGRSLFGSAGLHVYALHHDVQTGPLSLVLAWLFAHTPRNGFVVAAVLTAALGLLAVRRLEVSLRRPARTPAYETLVLAGGCIVAFTWAKLGGYGHLDDAITIAAAVVALTEIRDERPLRAGLAIGIGIAAKPWAVIFLPLTLARRPRDLRAPAVAGAVAAAAWLPFILAAPDSLKSLRPSVNVAPDSVLALFGVTTNAMPDWLRVAQLLAAIGVAAVLAMRCRAEAVVAAAIAMRVGTDPATWSYYTPGLVIGLFVWDLLRERRMPWFTMAAACALAPTWFVHSADARAGLRLTISAAVVGWAVWRPDPAV